MWLTRASWVLPAMEQGRRSCWGGSERQGGARWLGWWPMRGVEGDREVVLAAVKQSWHALQYAAEELRGDRGCAGGGEGGWGVLWSMRRRSWRGDRRLCWRRWRRVGMLWICGGGVEGRPGGCAGGGRRVGML